MIEGCISNGNYPDNGIVNEVDIYNICVVHLIT